jgi:hypothetical protein
MLRRLLPLRSFHKCMCTKNQSNEKLPPTEDVQKLLENSATFNDIKPSTEEDSWATMPYPEGTYKNFKRICETIHFA